MMNSMNEWSDFFVGAASAAAALAGLVTVAISVNVRQILKYKALPPRAAATIGILVLILVVSMAVLIPNQSLFWLGIEVIVFSTIAWALSALVIWSKILERQQRPWYELVYQIIINQLSVLPFIVGGIFLLLGNPDGFYWIAAGTIAAFILSMINSWVLLIEILR